MRIKLKRGSKRLTDSNFYTIKCTQEHWCWSLQTRVSKGLNHHVEFLNQSAYVDFRLLTMGLKFSLDCCSLYLSKSGLPKVLSACEYCILCTLSGTRRLGVLAFCILVEE